MASHLEITPLRNYLSASITGECSLAEAKDHFKQILDACVEYKLPRILIDVRTVTILLPMTTVKRFDFAEFLARAYWESPARQLKDFRLAYVGSPAHVDPGGFGETVARNRGINVKITTKMDDALAWIQAETPEA